MGFLDQWLWLLSMIAGLLLALTELAIGVSTGLDLVFIGSGLILAGLVTWPFHWWPLTIIVAAIICLAYVAIGRGYVHRWTLTKSQKTNVDAIIGRHGIVLKAIARNAIGLVKVGNEEWRAVSDSELAAGSEIEVVEVKGVTLTVTPAKGGS